MRISPPLIQATLVQEASLDSQSSRWVSSSHLSSAVLKAPTLTMLGFPRINKRIRGVNDGEVDDTWQEDKRHSGNSTLYTTGTVTSNGSSYQTGNSQITMISPPSLQPLCGIHLTNDMSTSGNPSAVPPLTVWDLLERIGVDPGE